ADDEVGLAVAVEIGDRLDRRVPAELAEYVLAGLAVDLDDVVRPAVRRPRGRARAVVDRECERLVAELQLVAPVELGTNHGGAVAEDVRVRVAFAERGAFEAEIELVLRRGAGFENRAATRGSDLRRDRRQKRRLGMRP